MFRGLGVAVVGGEDVGLVAGPPFFAYAGGVGEVFECFASADGDGSADHASARRADDGHREAVDEVQDGEVGVLAIGGDSGERGQVGRVVEVGASAAVDDQEGHGFELARVVAREVLGVDRDLETAKVYCGFVGDVEAVHGFVHRGVELAGVDLVQVDVRQLDAIEAGVRLADRSYVAELGEEHRDGTLSGGIVMGPDGYRDVDDRDVDRLRVRVWEVAWPVALQVSLGCRSVWWRLVWRCGRQGARQGLGRGMVTAGVLVLPWSGDVIKTHHTKTGSHVDRVKGRLRGLLFCNLS